MSRPNIAVFVEGRKNMTRVTIALPSSDASLDALRQAVAKKARGRNYYIFPVNKHWNRMGNEALFTWHVGEGCSHEEGWWII